MREYNPIKKNIIATTVIKTPLGDMFCAATNKGICILSFFKQKNLEDQIQRVQKFFKAEAIPAHNKYFDCLQKELDEYFEGKRIDFTVPLQLVGTSFQQSAWKILMSIPYGETISYKEEAALLKNPKAVRAVGSANGKNMISIIIPCHRVIQTGGKLGGYAGGLDKKEALLELENNHSSDIIRKNHSHEH
ncbi:methylated-DNA--[protein]-cysteine S-methyltransferase [Arcobacter sp. LA11]|uniref:methylated-DNA--[protein]-cysteine S-methyltransferase n=1 Tax=Arcobacter sp. LA11 TaxID=1898176 RepID=UPI0009342430|nr:methylated-DNA--[protein]-cysteine S-methyltransferase [Arcobacter sp. LA11]